jgi:hypothetical protein
MDVPVQTPAPMEAPVQTPAPGPAIEEPIAAEAAAGATIPPQSRPAAGVTSFEWPVAEPERKSKLPLVVVGAVIVALIAAVLGFVLLSGGGSKSPPVAKAKPTPPPPAAEPPVAPTKAPELIARTLKLRDQSTQVVATLRFSGPALGGKSVVTRDANMVDGRGRVEVRQKGVKTAVGGSSVPGLTIGLNDSGQKLVISLSAKAGAFTSVKASRDSTGHAVALRITKKPKPVAKPKRTQPVKASPTPQPPPPPASPSSSPPPSPPSSQERVDQLRRQRTQPPPPPPTASSLCKQLHRC